VRWLYARAWISEEPPSMLFDLAAAHQHADNRLTREDD
jgi:hypothetical protein